MSDRPERIVCIRKPKKDEEHLTWCGKTTLMSFVLTGLDHAACLQGSRLVACLECTAFACAELLKLSTEGQ